MTTDTPVRTALYARVSTDEQKKNKTIDSQLTEMVAFAERHGYEVVTIVQDDGVSGGLLLGDREHGKELLQAIGEGRINHILIYAQDRLGRTGLAPLTLMKNLMGYDVVVESVTEGIQNPDEGDFADEMSIHMRAIIAQDERRRIRERTMRGRREKRAAGLLVNPRKDLYGYSYIPKTSTEPGHYVINEEEAEVVRYIFDRFIGGMSIRGITRDLSEGPYWPPRSCYTPIVKRSGSPSKNWSKTTVRRILTNPAYKGQFFQGRWQTVRPKVKVALENLETEVPKEAKPRLILKPEAEWAGWVAIEPHIIDVETWDLVQRLVHADEPVPVRGREPSAYPLRGKVYCGICGRNYQRNRNGKLTYWRCSGSDSALPERCHNRQISDRKILAAVHSVLVTNLRHPQRPKLDLNGVRPRSEKAVQTSLTTVASALNRVKKAREKALEMAANDLMTEAELQALRGKQEAEREKLEAEYGDLAGELRTIRSRDAIVAFANKVIDSNQSEEILIRQYVRKVTVNGVEVKVEGAFYAGAGALKDVELGPSFSEEELQELQRDKAKCLGRCALRQPPPP